MVSAEIRFGFLVFSKLVVGWRSRYSLGRVVVNIEGILFKLERGIFLSR